MGSTQVLREPLSERAKGRWHGILTAIGIDARFLTGRHTACPLCNPSGDRRSDRYRFSDRDGSGSWICNQCGHGDGAELVKRLKGIPFAEAAKLIEEVIGEAKAEEPRKRLTDAQAKAKMRALWASGKRLTRDSFAGQYLASRGILCDPYPTALRICQSPLMLLGKVISPDGKAVNVHRTLPDRRRTQGRSRQDPHADGGNYPSRLRHPPGEPAGERWRFSRDCGGDRERALWRSSGGRWDAKSGRPGAPTASPPSWPLLG